MPRVFAGILVLAISALRLQAYIAESPNEAGSGIATKGCFTSCWRPLRFL